MATRENKIAESRTTLEGFLECRCEFEMMCVVFTAVRHCIVPIRMSMVLALPRFPIPASSLVLLVRTLHDSLSHRAIALCVVEHQSFWAVIVPRRWRGGRLTILMIRVRFTDVGQRCVAN